jgi:hypothetical protein
MEVREQGAAAADLIRSIVGEERESRGEDFFLLAKMWSRSVFAFLSGHLLSAQSRIQFRTERCTHR